MYIQQLIALGGRTGSIIYTRIWILGGILQPKYSYIRDYVNALLVVRVPNKRLFDIMYFTGILLVIVFFGTLHWTIDGGRGLIIAPVCFLLTNLIELGVTVFCPLGGEER